MTDATAQNNHKLKPEVRDEVYCFLYPEEYALSEKNKSDSSEIKVTDEFFLNFT